MEEALVAYLLASASLTTLVGLRGVYWGRATQNVPKPYCVMTRVSGSRDYVTTGPSGLIQSRVQIDCYATTYTGAKAVARQVEARLSGYSGTTGGKVFSSVFLDAERDFTEDDETPDKLFRTSLDFMIWHN